MALKYLHSLYTFFLTKLVSQVQAVFFQYSFYICLTLFAHWPAIVTQHQ